MKIAIASLYADPIHPGHLRYLKAAREMADHLLVIVNNDEQAKLKKGRPFMCLEERLEVIRAVRWVDWALPSIDWDRSVWNTLESVHSALSDMVELVFVNGGDVTVCREAPLCQRLGIAMAFGVGGYEKIQSSSALTAGCISPRRIDT